MGIYTKICILMSFMHFKIECFGFNRNLGQHRNNIRVATSLQVFDHVLALASHESLLQLISQNIFSGPLFQSRFVSGLKLAMKSNEHPLTFPEACEKKRI